MNDLIRLTLVHAFSIVPKSLNLRSSLLMKVLVSLLSAIHSLRGDS